MGNFQMVEFENILFCLLKTQKVFFIFYIVYSCFIRQRVPHWRNAEKRKNKESAKKY
ncbi:MAG: hypothetical protein MAG581_02588 [Deltaproteobacteria bacterium]|jgi:hypothetical protein|nr:hypothetical protein [Deltaproteobacteria bacterium]